MERENEFPVKLQKAVIFLMTGDVVNEHPLFCLSGIPSEWLMASGFWKRINMKYGTMFDSYEEDEADAPLVRKIAQELDDRIVSLKESDKNIISFKHGWSPDGKEWWSDIQKEDLLEELIAFRDFLIDAANKNYRLEFAL
jgi:hypothetical protein